MSTLKEKIINRVPGRAWGPMNYGKGTENVFQAVKHLIFNPDNYVQDQLNHTHYLLNNQSLSERDREDLEGYLAHRDGMAMYLGLPQNSDSFIPAEYTPTRGKFVNDKGYYIRYMRNRPVLEGIMEAYNDPNNQELLNNGRGVQLVSPYSRAYSLSKGRDNKGEYAAIYDEWDYHLFANQLQEIDNRNQKDIIAPIVGGKPFSIYDRIYLDDFYNVPEQYRGTTYLPEVTVAANPENITERDMILRVLSNFGRLFKLPLETLNDKQISSLITNRNLSGDELIKEWESKGLLKKQTGGTINYLDYIRNTSPYRLSTLVENPWAISYFINNPNTAGMAIGGGMNGVDGERAVLLNPFNNNILKKESGYSVLANEKLRHWMDKINFILPDITTELTSKYIGTPYENDILNIGRTEAARYLSGDHNHSLSNEQKEYANKMLKQESKNRNYINLLK